MTDNPATWLDLGDRALRLLTTLIGLAVVVVIFKRDWFNSLLSYAKLAAYAKKHGRSVIVLNHAGRGGGFGASMLTMDDVLKVERFIRRAEGRPIDLILTTFGGQLIAGTRLAHTLKRHPNVRLVVPKFAYSAGTLATLGAQSTLADPLAMFGPVDPQLGWILDGIHSAKDWQTIARNKGSEARDSSIAFSEVGRRLMTETEAHVRALLPIAADADATVTLLLTGDHSHARTVNASELADLGLHIHITELPEAGDLAERTTDGLHKYLHRGKR